MKESLIEENDEIYKRDEELMDRLGANSSFEQLKLEDELDEFVIKFGICSDILDPFIVRFSR